MKQLHYDFSNVRNNKTIYTSIRKQLRYANWQYKLRETTEDYIVLVSLSNYISKLEKELNSFYPQIKPIKSFSRYIDSE